MNRNEYRRALIMLRSLKGGVSGYVRLERRTLMGTLQYTLNGAPTGCELYAVLLYPKSGTWHAVKCDRFGAPRSGQTGIIWKFDPRNIEGRTLEQYALTAVIEIRNGVCELLLCGNLNGTVQTDWQQIRDAACRLFSPVRISGAPISPIGITPPCCEDKAHKEDVPSEDNIQTLPDFSEEIPAYPSEAESSHEDTLSVAPLETSENIPALDVNHSAQDDMSNEKAYSSDTNLQMESIIPQNTLPNESSVSIFPLEQSKKDLNADELDISPRNTDNEGISLLNVSVESDEFDVPAQEVILSDELDTPAQKPVLPDEFDMPAEDENEQGASLFMIPIESDEFDTPAQRPVLPDDFDTPAQAPILPDEFDTPAQSPILPDELDTPTRDVSEIEESSLFTVLLESEKFDTPVQDTISVDELDIPSPAESISENSKDISSAVEKEEISEMPLVIVKDELDMPAEEPERLNIPAHEACILPDVPSDAPIESSPAPKTAGEQLELSDPNATWSASIEPLRHLFFSSEVVTPFEAEGYVFIRVPLSEESEPFSCLCGIYCEDGVPARVCYAIPALYTPEPPPGLENYIWKGEQTRGYWVTCDAVPPAPSN